MLRFTIKDICFVTALIAAITALWLAEQRSSRLERLIRSERAVSKTARSEFERVLRENNNLRVKGLQTRRFHDIFYTRLREHIDLTDNELQALQTDISMRIFEPSKSSGPQAAASPAAGPDESSSRLTQKNSANDFHRALSP